MCVLERFAEGVEDKLRAGGVAVTTISETMGLLNRAVGVLNGVAQTTMNVAGDAITAAQKAVEQVGAPTPTPTPTPAPTTAVPPTTTPDANQPPRPNGP